MRHSSDNSISRVPPRGAIPRSNDPRWVLWGNALLRWMRGRKAPLERVGGQVAPGWSHAFLTNVIAWLEHAGKLVYGIDGWGHICERDGCKRAATRQRYCSSGCMKAQRSYRNNQGLCSTRRTAVCSHEGCSDPVPKRRLKFCSSRCQHLDKMRKQQLVWREGRKLKSLVPKKCIGCGRRLMAPPGVHGRMKYCSVKCRDREWHRKKHVPAKRVIRSSGVCAYRLCDNEYESIIRIQRYCSPDCRKIAAIERRRNVAS